MKKTIIIFCLLLGLAIPLIAGCDNYNNVVVRKIYATDETTPGLRYYGSAPYLLVKQTVDSTNKITYSIDIIYLPDRSQVYAVELPKAPGKTEVNITLKDGEMLQIFNTIRDVKSTEEIIATPLSGLLSAFVTTAGAKGGDNVSKTGFQFLIKPGLYRLVYSKTDPSKIEKIERVEWPDVQVIEAKKTE
ncbi:MAG: hypothetical protein M1269_12770 [Chloroflexi bacterium]|nr:hypothetical protein [Chloroflexota bacterium]